VHFSIASASGGWEAAGRSAANGLTGEAFAHLAGHAVAGPPLWLCIANELLPRIAAAL